jgi:uncharacterized phage protein gp47/JayE
MAFDIISPNYNSKSYQDIFTKLLEMGYAKELLSDDTHFLEYVEQTKDIENTMILDLSVMALMLSYVYMDLTKAYNSMDIDKATGYELDKLLKILITRYLPDYAIGEVTFGLNEALPDNIYIASGTRVTTSGERPVVYVTTESKTLIAGQTAINIPVRCLELGTIGNIPAHDIDTVTSPLIGVDTVDNELRFTGGSDPEADDYYRLRGKQWRYILPKGTYDAFVSALGGVSSVEGFNIHRYWRGYGTTKIVIDPPIQIVLDRVELAIAEVEAVDEDITIVGTELVNINASMILNISIDETLPATQENIDQVTLKVQNAVKTYIDGGNNNDGTIKNGMSIGQDFIPLQACAYVLTQVPELKNIQVINPTSPITISADQKAHSGTIRITGVV